MFPLLNALSTGPMWLQWTNFDSFETVCSWAAGVLLVTLTLSLPATLRKPGWVDPLLAAWLLVGITFAAGALVKVDGLKARLQAYRGIGDVPIVIAAVLVAGMLLLLLRFPGKGAFSRIQRGVFALWPIVLLFTFHLLRAPSAAATQGALASAPAGVSKTSSAVAPPTSLSSPTDKKIRTVILLFDELSPDYLYGARQVDLSKLSSLSVLRSEGDIHRGAHLHGGGTAIAIPALFGASDTAPEGLVPALMEQGLSVHVWGWYHDYCHDVTPGAVVCHSTSFYNPRTLHDGFSIVDPWWTDLNLMPSDFPFGLLKAPPAVAFHRRTLQAARAWLASQLEDRTADVIYAHVNVPHVPILASEINGQRVTQPFVVTETSYVSQFSAVDDIVSVALASHTRPTQLIIISDHNARSLLPQVQHEHITFIRWRSWVPGAHTIARSENAADLVARMSLNPDQP